jgi:nucleotide-binding universal stress UspA family protein
MAADQPTTTNIVVGVDGSEASTRAAEWAADQAELTGGRLELVSAWEYPMSWGNVIPLPHDFNPEADARAVIDPILADLRSSHPNLDIHLHVVEGHAAEVLIEASKHAALLVVSSRGHRSFSGVVLGSVSQNCVTHAECPVVVFRSPAHHKHGKHAG